MRKSQWSLNGCISGQVVHEGTGHVQDAANKSLQRTLGNVANMREYKHAFRLASAYSGYRARVRLSVSPLYKACTCAAIVNRSYDNVLYVVTNHTLA